ncbi:uncharacterized protein BX663DRAFT_551410 [Cokeromyces recurvatus]|uniref:uncharacterized protein n=1 Tax=Cokeromyces recurvatus TaxID=90255 RepID=UPI002220D3BB|nr:uncharacterized protein BX663DRAFT_551410 [Cokeromyces recurvatus]KAI7903731.1 hypothetical protein BX663DRAFT_551410 [Cokeromyces recurvatus]
MYFQVIINSFSGFGPFCFCFKTNEPCTVYDVKQRLEKTTAVSVEQQRIRSLGGKILTDSDDLTQNYFMNKGPIILNLTVRLIGGRTYNTMIMEEENEALTVNQTSLIKKFKSETEDSISIQHMEEIPIQIRYDKGKRKETKKRKLLQ